MYYFYILFVITLGTLFRFANLDRMVYWGDEVYSSIRMFGYTTAEIYQTIAQQPLTTAATLQQFQQIDAARGLGAVWHSLATEDPHITPLYFLIAHLWARGFGSSALSLRSLSGLCGVALIPIVYWLAIELFGRRRIALCATALVAISPTHLVFAQEARMYSLWTTLTIAGGAALLRAIRRQTWGSWLVVSLVMSASLYTHFLAVVPLLGYAIYTIGLYRHDRLIRQRAIAAFSLAGLSFLPWVWVFVTRQVVAQEDGTNKPLHLGEGIKNWFGLFRRIFVDLNTSLQDSFPMAIGLISLALGGAILSILALYRLQRETPIETWLFVGLLTLGLPIGLFSQSLYGILPSRYLLPSSVGLLLAIGYLLGSWRSFTRPTTPWPLRWIGASCLTLLILTGIASGGTYAQASNWWNKDFSNCNPDIAQWINQSPHPLIISDGTGGPFFDYALSNIISVARIVKPETQFQINTSPQPMTDGRAESIDIAAGNFSDRYVLTPSRTLRESLQATYGDRLEPLIELPRQYRGSTVYLWRLNPPNDPASD
jgi:uncharacterized membrane protein